MQRSEEEYAALKDNIKAAKDAKRKVEPLQTDAAVITLLRS